MRRAGSLLLSPLLALLLATPFAGAALAQEFPSRPISIVVPFPPGGAVDSAARVLAAELAETSGKIFVVDNRAGGGNGVVGASEVVKSTPDGYTLLFNASIHVVTPLINKKVPYDVINDFTSIAGVAAGPLIISTPPSTKANTLKEFFAAVKADPDSFNFATSGYGSAGHLTIEFLKTQTGVDTDVVSYKGAGPALSDLMGGQVQLMADPMMSSLPHVKSGRLKALAVTSAKRSPLAPDVPTVAESGLPALEMLSWYAVWGPKNLDPKAAAYLSDAIAKVVKSDKFKEKLTVFGFEPMYMNGGELQAFVVSESKRYSDIVKAGNLKVD
ncbi:MULTISPECIES: tripartite tricarboxylate transporter substrate binding protein [unclassified Beijerinckia]|uniref:Bug family tripartite tricarboxylate transporter substrate binding protein n=1 Tax=unclassified Beijerinckia TaxID=2638183 RepID=UPI00089A7870|nr:MULTISPECIES: tripartite tricarboxylate transporter substrate binding protein [unclassified Beijerinckia]MDH7797099.1 tripartite-type tricarboxylate transporter receptor subunit TctC [Beijerinckia sp. GAS462]SEC72185.1 Tripartite-type tricarboxylate transporter, receptor component TctC [Beijerinckia sp. 28-YEA-48]